MLRLLEESFFRLAAVLLCVIVINAATSLLGYTLLSEFVMEEAYDILIISAMLWLIFLPFGKKG